MAQIDALDIRIQSEDNGSLLSASTSLVEEATPSPTTQIDTQPQTPNICFDFEITEIQLTDDPDDSNNDDLAEADEDAKTATHLPPTEPSASPAPATPDYRSRAGSTTSISIHANSALDKGKGPHLETASDLQPVALDTGPTPATPDLEALIARPNYAFRSTSADRQAFQQIFKEGTVLRSNMSYMRVEEAIKTYELYRTKMTKLVTERSVLRGNDPYWHEDIKRIPIEDLIAIRTLVASSNELNQALRENDQETLKRLSPYLKTVISGLNQLPRFDESGVARGWWPKPKKLASEDLPPLFEAMIKTDGWTKDGRLDESTCFSEVERNTYQLRMFSEDPDAVVNDMNEDLKRRIDGLYQAGMERDWHTKPQLRLLRGAKLTNDILNSYTFGKIVTHPGFTHASLTPNNYTEFRWDDNETAFNAQFVIYNMKTGKRLNELSYYGHADGDEVVFLPSTRFLVIGVEDCGTGCLDENDQYNYPERRIHLYEMPPADDTQHQAQHDEAT
ncbi:hypothetical protein ACFQUU_28280 [Herbaspirillum sp. GCM10030257]|uniref:hypothetical protein n=1 Tax=Herbaspirillum sp. GCM10030257 TaxID=3273393 RepID=UPI003617C0C6